jgi:hypothetical protein
MLGFAYEDGLFSVCEVAEKRSLIPFTGEV